MKLLVLYEELAGYFLSCVNAFAEKQKGKILIIRKEVNAVAPFQFSDSENVKIIDRSLFDEKTLRGIISEFSPDAIFCAGWGYKPYLEICLQYQKKLPIILGFDNWWNGSMKQRLSVTFAKSYFSKRFNRCFVPGKPQKEFALRLGFAENKIATGAYACDFNHFNNYYLSNKNSKKVYFPKPIAMAMKMFIVAALMSVAAAIEIGKQVGPVGFNASADTQTGAAIGANAGPLDVKAKVSPQDGAEFGANAGPAGFNAARAEGNRNARSSNVGSEAQTCVGASLRLSGALRMRAAAEGPAALSRLS